MKFFLCTIALGVTVFCGCATTKPEDGDASADKPDLPGPPEATASSDSSESKRGNGSHGSNFRDGDGDKGESEELGNIDNPVASRDVRAKENDAFGANSGQRSPEATASSDSSEPKQGNGSHGSNSRNGNGDKGELEESGNVDNPSASNDVRAKKNDASESGDPLVPEDTEADSTDSNSDVTNPLDISASTDLPNPAIALPKDGAAEETESGEPRQNSPADGKDSRTPPVIEGAHPDEPVTPSSGGPPLGLNEIGSKESPLPGQEVPALSSPGPTKSSDGTDSVDLTSEELPPDAKLTEGPDLQGPIASGPTASNPTSENSAKEGQGVHEGDGPSVAPESTSPDEDGLGPSESSPREKSLGSWFRRGGDRSAVGFSDPLPPESFAAGGDSSSIGFTNPHRVGSWLKAHPIRRVGFSDQPDERASSTDEAPRRKLSFRADDWEYRSTASWLQARDRDQANRPNENDRSYTATKAWLERNLPIWSDSSDWSPREYAQVEEWLRTEGEVNTLRKLNSGSNRNYRALSNWLGRRPVSRTEQDPASGTNPRRDYSKVMKWLRDSREP